MTVTRDGRSGVGLTMRDWTPAESAFTLNSAPVEEVASGGSAGEVTETDVVFDQRTAAVVNYHAQVTASVFCEFNSLHPSIATVGTDGKVTRVSNGTARILAKSAKCQKSIDVAVSQVGGQTINSFLRYVPGSLARHCVDAVDAAIAGKTPSVAMPVYTTQDHAAGVYVRNAGCWAAIADLTPLSPWNSYGGVNKAGTLVSPRHLVLAKHYWPAVGMQFRFVTADNVVVTRTMTAYIDVADTDITVGVLDSDVPGSISFVKVMPLTSLNKVPHISTVYTSTPAFGIPGVGFDQEEKAILFEWVADYLSSPYQYAIIRTPTDATRLTFHENVISGDSGNPFCLFVNGQLLMLFTWLGATGGSCFRYHAAAVNAAMTTLGGGYELTTADLSGFPTY